MSFDYFVSIKCGNVTNAQLQLWNHVPHMRCFYELFWQDGRTLMAVHTLDPDTTFVPSSCLHPLSLRTKLEPTDYPRADAVFDTNCFADKMRVVDVLKHCGSFVRIFLYEVLCMDVYICSETLRELMSPLVTFHGEQQLLHMLTLLRNHLYSKVWVHSDLQVHSLHHLGTTNLYFNDRTCVFQKWQRGAGVLRVKPGRVVTSTSMVSLMQTLLQNTQAPCLVIIQHYLMGQWRHMLTTCFPQLGALFLSDASSFQTVCVESYQTCDLVLCTDKYLQVDGVTDRLRVSELNRCCRPTDTQVPLNFWRWKQLVHTWEVVNSCKTILWNGPLGVFELETFSKGTISLGNSIDRATKNGAFSLVGGGDSVAAVKQFGFADKVSYVSTGGGAMLETLEGKNLPGIDAILS